MLHSATIKAENALLLLKRSTGYENGVLLVYTLEGVSSVANLIIAYEESQ